MKRTTGRVVAAEVTKLRCVYDWEGNTLSVWFEDPRKEHISEETGKEVILVKDKKGRVIGFEKLNFLPKGQGISGKKLSVDAVVS